MVDMVESQRKNTVQHFYNTESPVNITDWSNLMRTKKSCRSIQQVTLNACKEERRRPFLVLFLPNDNHKEEMRHESQSQQPQVVGTPFQDWQAQKKRCRSSAIVSRMKGAFAKKSWCWNNVENYTRACRQRAPEPEHACATNTIESEAEFLSWNRPSVELQAKQRALREVYFTIQTRPRAVLYLDFSTVTFYEDNSLLKKKENRG